MSAKWPEVPLGEVLTHRKEFIRIDDTQEYVRCRVQLHAKGIVVRDRVEGAIIKTKSQQVCRAAELLVAEIDAKVGGYGVVPAELDGAIVSSHYFLFTVDHDRLDHRFLDYYVKTPGFAEQVRAQGSTNYAAIRPQHVLEYRIPLPPLAEQRRLVEKIERLVAKVEEARGLRTTAMAATELLAAAQATRIFDRLASGPTAPIRSLGVDGHNPVQTGPFGAQLHVSDFVEAGVPVLNVGNVWPDGLRLDRLDHVLPRKAERLQRYSLKAGDLLFARSGTVGKVCLVPNRCDGWLMTGHLFRVRLDAARIDTRFAFAGFRGAQFVRGQVLGQVRGATRPGFNTTLLGNVRIPVPPLDVQQQVVAELDGLLDKADRLARLQAKTGTELAMTTRAILDRAFWGEL